MRYNMLTIFMVIIDQLLKYYIYTNRPQIVLIQNWLGITYAENTGTVFGLAQGSNIIFMIHILMLQIHILILQIIL